MVKRYFWLVVVGALILASIACSSSGDNTGKKVGEITNTQEPAQVGKPTTENSQPPASQPTEKPSPTPKQESFKTGDVIELKDTRIALNGGEYTGKILKLNFSILNTGSDDLNVSSMLSFSAKDGEGSKLDQEIIDCGTSIDGKVLPGDVVRGDVCYTMANPGKFKVYFENNLFSSGAVVWDLDTAEMTGIPDAGVSFTDGSTSVEIYKVGDIVELKDQKVTLNTAGITGNVLKANFTIENTGNEDLNLSSLISFSAKGSDGTKFELDIFDCGGSQIDGKVLPGDKVKGDICWKTGRATSAKVYYEAGLLSSGAVVWDVK